MGTTRITTVMARPIEEVFAVLTDVELTGRWFPWNVEEHWTSPPPHGVGSIRHAVIRMGGRRTENDAVVVEYDPPRRAVMEGVPPAAPFRATLAFTPEAGATQVDVTIDFAFRGAQRLVGPIFEVLYRRAWIRGLANLQRMLESGLLGPRSAVVVPSDQRPAR